MTLTVRQLAEQIGGEVAGNGDLPIENARPLSDAQHGDITFIDGDKNLSALHDSRASAAVVPLNTPVNGKPLIRVKDPLAAFAAVVLKFRPIRSQAANGTIDPRASIHPTAVVGQGTTVGPFVAIGEGAVIGDGCHLHAGVSVGRFCTLGDGVVLHPHVAVYDDCKLGNRVVVHANSVIGADGFGYRTQAGSHVKVPQIGTVEIGDDVEIGSCTTIDRGTFGPTRVGSGTKIDNLVMIAHNCQIGRHNMFVGQVGIAGSCTTGDYVVMGGQVGLADHVTIGERSLLGARSGVVKDVPPGSRILGHPALPYKLAQRVMLSLGKLPDLLQEVRKIKNTLGMKDDP